MLIPGFFYATLDAEKNVTILETLLLQLAKIIPHSNTTSLVVSFPASGFAIAYTIVSATLQ
jgi:hypothetical protein